MLYSILKYYFRILLALYFKNITILNSSMVRKNHPILLYSNHSNALLDPVLILSSINEPARITATSTLRNKPIVGKLLSKLHVLFLHRRVDGHSNEVMKKNNEILNSCVETLHEKRILLLFPEGRSYPGQELIQFKNGISRIIKKYHEKYGYDLQVQPIHINYRGKGSFRSDVSINFLQPITSYPKNDKDFVINTTKMLEGIIRGEQGKYDTIEIHKKYTDKFLYTLSLMLFFPLIIIKPLTDLIARKEEEIDTVRILLSFLLIPIWISVQLIFFSQYLLLYILTVQVVTIFSPHLRYNKNNTSFRTNN